MSLKTDATSGGNAKKQNDKEEDGEDKAGSGVSGADEFEVKMERVPIIGEKPRSAQSPNTYLSYSSSSI